MVTNRHNITDRREDISRFVVHLARDDRKDWPYGGADAHDNLLTILRDRTVGAFRPHCLHSKQLDTLTKSQKTAFNVACFTEIPLNQIHLLTQTIVGAKYQREPYGIVLDKKFLIEEGAQPAIYVNSYGSNASIRDAFDEIFQKSKEDGFKNKQWRVLPFVNAMHERYDFTWNENGALWESSNFLFQN